MVKARMRQKFQRLEQAHAIERERQRIARDIHDDLGAGLTQILLQSSLASRETSGQTRTDLNQISDNTRELVRKMDEIVWAVTPEKDTLDSLVTYIGKFVQEFCAAVQIRCRMDLPAQLPNIAVSTEVRHSLFLAVKEAMNNIAKHAGATEASLQFKLQPDAFSFFITDDGVGLKTGNGQTQDRIFSGRGLQNIAQRLEKIGGTCVVSAAPDKGTQVELTVQINHKH
jgi:signal transduction histidine kinase